jgi:UDP-N-acetylmuramoylalanine-D-glutamate ligase
MPKLLGNRVYLEMPKQEEENKIVVDENTKEALQREMLKKFSKLTVHTVGDTISNVKKGDVVLVDPGVLGKAPLVDLSETEQVLLVSPFDIIMIW